MQKEYFIVVTEGRIHQEEKNVLSSIDFSSWGTTSERVGG